MSPALVGRSWGRSLAETPSPVVPFSTLETPAGPRAGCPDAVTAAGFPGQAAILRLNESHGQAAGAGSTDVHLLLGVFVSRLVHGVVFQGGAQITPDCPAVGICWACFRESAGRIA